MQTDLAAEQNKNITWPESRWNQSDRKRKRSMEKRICWRAKLWVQNEILNE